MELNFKDDRIRQYIDYKMDNDIIQIYLKDMMETFEFTDEEKAQEFLDNQYIERFGNYQDQKDYFDYEDSNGKIRRFHIGKIYKGEIRSWIED